MSIQIGGLSVAVSAIIPAAGSGKRMGGGTAKQFLPLRGEPVLVRTVKLFSECPLVDEIVIAAGDVESTRELVAHFPKVTYVVQGGAERQDSVWAALQVVHSRPRIVCVHDAVRPLLTMDLLEGILRAAADHPAQVLGVPVKDTVKIVAADCHVVTTPERPTVFAAQTPQVFWVEPMAHAFRQAIADGVVGTDCASLLERMGVPVKIYPGSHENIKLTTPEDFLVAEAILERRAKG